MFGKEHYRDILEEIVFKLFDRDNQRAKKIAWFVSKTIKIVSKALSGGVINLNPNPQTIFSLLKRDDFKNLVICFDDIERLSKKLDIRDFLGLLSQLKEDKHCKVVIILNQNQLNGSHAQDFDKFAEKTIDINLRYAPSIENSFEIANEVIKDDISYAIFKVFDKSKILEIFREISLDNIRIMIYILEALSDFADELQKFDELNNEFVGDLLDKIIKNLAYLKVFGYSDTLDLSRYLKLNEKEPYSEFENIVNRDNGTPRTKDEEKEYLQIKDKFPNFVKYENLLKIIRYYPNEFTEMIKFYYENSHISKNYIDDLKKINIEKNIDKSIDDFFKVNSSLVDYSINYNELESEAYKRFEKMYSYKDNIYLYEKIASYNEGFSVIEDIIKIFELDLTNLSLDLNNFYATIFDNIHSLQTSNESKEKLLATIFVSNSQNETIQDFKEKHKNKDKNLTTRDILLRLN